MLFTHTKQCACRPLGYGRRDRSLLPLRSSWRIISHAGQTGRDGAFLGYENDADIIPTRLRDPVLKTVATDTCPLEAVNISSSIPSTQLDQEHKLLVR